VLLHGNRVVELFVEFVAADLAEVVSASEKNMFARSRSAFLDGDGLAGHEGRIDRRQGVGLGGLILGRILLDELYVLALEAVEDHVEVERVGMLKLMTSTSKIPSLRAHRCRGVELSPAR